MAVKIERATVNDGPAIVQLLSANELPIDGLVDHGGTALVARAGHRVIGCAALEIYADGALLRSVAVDAEAGGRGLGRDLTDAALAWAASLGMPSVYLLTTAAERYFARLGFTRIAREQVPSSVRQSVEFRSACPASAIAMKRALAAARLW